MNARRFLFALVLAWAFSPSPSAGQAHLEERVASKQFSVGQVWSYATRPGEEGSRVHVGRIESVDGHVVVHVKLTGLRIRSGGQIGTVVAHMPIAEDALARSVTRRSDEPVDLEGLEDGYTMWRQAFEAGQAGYFTLPLADTIAGLEKALDSQQNAGEPE